MGESLMLYSLFGFVLLIGILVSIHEYGHFIVARLCGVKVLKFSIGFGPTLLSKTSKKSGTEYIVAALPLGGYVKFLDERDTEQAISDDQLPFSYNNKPVWQRMCIVLAGPVFNFILALFVFVALSLYGITELKAVVGATSGVAAELGIVANDEFVAVDGNRATSWDQVGHALSSRIGDSGELHLVLQRDGYEYDVKLAIETWLGELKDPNPIRELGLNYRLANAVNPIPDGAAANAGMLKNDEIQRINLQPVAYWHHIIEQVQPLAGQTAQFEILRDGELLNFAVTVDNADGIGRIGVYPAKIADDWYEHEYSVWQSIEYSANKIWQSAELILKIAGRMLQGNVSVDNLSGPLAIADIAGDAVQTGPMYFLQLLALLSITLGVMNLLPLPILDGGHFVYLCIEAVIKRPVSDKLQMILGQMGMALLLILMVTAVFNDIGRIKF